MVGGIFRLLNKRYIGKERKRNENSTELLIGENSENPFLEKSLLSVFWDFLKNTFYVVKFLKKFRDVDFYPHPAKPFN